MSNPVFVEAGRRGAAKRWGPTRVVRLDRLDDETARLVRALLAQAPQNAKKATAEQDPVPALERTRRRRRPAIVEPEAAPVVDR